MWSDTDREVRSTRAETCPSANFVKGKKANLPLLTFSMGIEGGRITAPFNVNQIKVSDQLHCPATGTH